MPAEAAAVSAESAVKAEAAVAPAESLAQAEPAVAAKPRLATAIARDAFTASELDPNAGAAMGSSAEVPAAVSELRAARQDLRAARRDVNQGTATLKERVALREARQDVRTARQHLREANSGGEALPIKPDVFSPVDESPVELFPNPAEILPEAPGLLPTPPGLLPETPEIVPESPIDLAPPQNNGLALGKTLPPISQIKPNGFAHGYQNGDMNCAPASMAMVARGIPGGVLDGKPIDQMSDAELINRLGRHGQTDREGTSPNGVIAMAEELGLSTSGRQGGLNQDYYDSVLANGGSIVANGAYHDDNGEPVGHFVTVTGKTFDGNYVVNDPRLGETIVVTPAQLDAFLRNNPVNGGVSIGVF